MAVPNVPDVALIPATDYVPGADENPTTAPLSRGVFGGASSFRRLSGALVPASSGWCNVLSDWEGTRSGLGAGVKVRLGAALASWPSLVYLTEAGGDRAYALRIDDGSVDIYRYDTVAGNGWIAGSEQPLAAGDWLALIVNEDGVAGFHSSDGHAWTRFAQSANTDIGNTVLLGAGLETQDGVFAATSLSFGALTGTPEPLDLTANPGAFHYSWNVQPDLSWGEGTVIFVQDWGARKWPERLQALREQDCEVYEYVMPTSDYPWDDGTNNGVPERVSFYGQTGDPDVYRRSDIPVEYYWDPDNPDRIYDPAYNGRCMDMRIGSAWVEHLLGWFRQRVADPNWRLDGWELDVTGTGYVGNWWYYDPRNPEASTDPEDGPVGYVQGFPDDEVEAYREGIVDFVERLREIVGPEVIFICNNSWDPSYVPKAGTINGVIIENHPQGNIPYWRDQQLPLHTPPLGRRRNFSISPNKDDMFEWAQVPLVTHAGYTAEDHYIIAVPLPYTDDATGTVFDNREWPEEWNHIHMWEWTDPGPDPPDPPDPVPPSEGTTLMLHRLLNGM